jgi:5-methyltetrahydrofolate--homocysteine methyltransferase
VPPEKFVEAFTAENADVVAMSALLTTTMNEMKSTVEAFTAAGLRDEAIIMVGGAPLTENFCQSIGADIYAADAATAADAAKQAILKKRGA